MTQCVLHTHTLSLTLTRVLQCFVLARFAFFPLVLPLSVWKMLFQRFSKLNTIFVAFFTLRLVFIRFHCCWCCSTVYKTLYSSKQIESMEATGRERKHTNAQREGEGGTDRQKNTRQCFSSFFYRCCCSGTHNKKNRKGKKKKWKRIISNWQQTLRSVTKDVLYVLTQMRATSLHSHPAFDTHFFFLLTSWDDDDDNDIVDRGTQKSKMLWK